jgi:hypothetical protein
MPITKNGYYNDPAIGEAFGNIADIFKPPSATEAYAAAKAAETKQHINVLAELYAHANDPSVSLDQLDRAGAVTGVFNPTQGFGARNMDDATKRYGVDKTTAAAIANNKADNNQKMAQTRYGAIAEGASLPAMPANVASLYGLPESGAVGGGVKLNQGETYTAPDGLSYGGKAALAGTPKPLTDAEYKAAEMARLQKEGKLTDPNMMSLIMSGAPTEDVVDPVTGQAIIKPRNEAVGMQPAPKKLIQGTPDQFKQTESQAKAQLTADEMVEPAKRVEALISSGEFPNDLGDYYLNQSTNATTAPFTMPNMSPAAQQVYSDLKNLTSTYLYYKSGAAQSPSEEETQKALIVPVPGEDPGLTKTKMQTIQYRINFIRAASGAKSAQPTASAPGSPAPAAPAAKNWVLQDGKLVPAP